jgi:hypothetical protein
MLRALTRETQDEVHGVAWPHFRLTWQEGHAFPSEVAGELVSVRIEDRTVDFVVGPGGRIVESRGPLDAHPDTFAPVARAPAADGRPSRPTYVLAAGVALPA